MSTPNGTATAAATTRPKRFPGAEPRLRVARHLGHGERTDPDEGDLGQRDLTRPAGQRDERQHDDRGDEREREAAEIGGVEPAERGDHADDADHSDEPEGGPTHGRDFRHAVRGHDPTEFDARGGQRQQRHEQDHRRDGGRHRAPPALQVQEVQCEALDDADHQPTDERPRQAAEPSDDRGRERIDDEQRQRVDS